MNPPTLHSLIERVRAGDSDAVEALMREYGDAIRREVRFNLLDQRLRRVVSESDIFQSVISRLVFGLQAGAYEFSTGRDVVNLLKVMVRARVAQHARFWSSQRRDLARNCSLSADDSVADSNGINASERSADVELAALAIELVPEIDRTILGWRDWGMGWDEIAGRLNAASGEAARKAHRRSLERVAANLNQLIGLGLDRGKLGSVLPDKADHE